jgi:hypothetical protein
VKSEVIPMIAGESGIRNGQDLWFTKLEPFAEELARPRPDYFDGALRADIAPDVRTALKEHIIPTSTAAPIAPNFFLEVKGPDGSGKVAVRQAYYDGAIGARRMQSLSVWSRTVI